ncbi:hypothetical protein AEQU3_02708 [Aequorivita antarctica]|nr:hypothetical protein AEQU3_02708 [Aequorivita antarctica]
MVLKVEKETIGHNDIFNKDVVNYHYFEVVVDQDGNTMDQLTQLAIHIPPSANDSKNPPTITSKLISENLAGVRR